MKDAIEAVEEAFKQFALGNVRMPVRSSVTIEQNNGNMLTMPVYIGGDMNAIGQKVVTVSTRRTQRKTGSHHRGPHNTTMEPMWKPEGLTTR